MTNTHGSLGSVWIAFYPPDNSRLPSIGTFCTELGGKGADPESAGLALSGELPDGAELRQEHTLDVYNLPRVVIVHGGDDAMTGLVVGAALRRQAEVYLVGEGAQALFVKLTSEGIEGLRLAATPGDAADEAIRLALS